MINRQYHYILRAYSEDGRQYTQRCGIVNHSSWLSKPAIPAREVVREFEECDDVKDSDKSVQVYRFTRL